MDFSELMIRFGNDVKRRREVEDFRKDLDDLPPYLYTDAAGRLPRICAGEIVRKRRDGTERKTYTGIVTLTFGMAEHEEDLMRMKAMAATWPTTMAAMVAASGKAVVILVKGTCEDGTLPQETEAIQHFHQLLYQQCAQVYSSLLGIPPTAHAASKTDTFAWTYDPAPYYDAEAAPVKVMHHALLPPIIEGTETAMKYGPESCVPSAQQDELWRRCFALAVEKRAGAETGDLEAVTLEALRLGIPQEDTVRQATGHLRWKTMKAEHVRAIVESVYMKNLSQKGNERQNVTQAKTYRLSEFVHTHYDLRFNLLTRCVEWRRNHSGALTFETLDTRQLNTMLQECHESGLDIKERDMKRYLSSTRIRDYHAARAYLYAQKGKWDGRTDYIGAIADRVPCHNPHWRKWFHTWFLSVVEHWCEDSRRPTCTSIPLLVGQEESGKDHFGEWLLPPALREAGYKELPDFANAKETVRVGSSAWLVGINNINLMSKKTRHSVIEALLQKNAVPEQLTYSRMTQETSGYTSYVATSSGVEILASASVARHFIVADLRHGAVIDYSGTWHHDEAYAQAVAELEAGERAYFDIEELRQIESYNQQYHTMCPEVSRFLDIFEPMVEACEGTRKLKLSDITRIIQQRTGYEYNDKTMNSLGRWLTGEARTGRLRRTISNGSPRYLVREGAKAMQSAR
ncbi:MAG: hypothetical protein K6A32_06550 [Bacteroidales bacterium]|nr:hypothetical protein [Bacteroidales bacterium]